MQGGYGRKVKIGLHTISPIDLDRRRRIGINGIAIIRDGVSNIERGIDLLWDSVPVRERSRWRSDRVPCRQRLKRLSESLLHGWKL
jgi:hypothetical protein